MDFRKYLILIIDFMCIDVDFCQDLMARRFLEIDFSVPGNEERLEGIFHDTREKVTS